MEPGAWVRSVAPDWAIVMAAAGVVGAVSAIVSIAVYREVLGDDEMPVPVESEVRG